MYRVTDLNNLNEYSRSSNFYNLNEAQDDFDLKKEKGLNVVLETIKFKVLICDSIIEYSYPGYDYYTSKIDNLDFIIRSLLLGEEHIELYKVTGNWKNPGIIINLIPLLKDDYSLESLIYHCFDKIFPQSRFLSSLVINLLDQYELKEKTKEETLSVFNHLIKISFDEKQKEILKDVIKDYLE